MKDPIIILGPGRCGSTLLQRILNTSENITIWGEHAGFLSDLAKSYYKLTDSEDIKRNFYSQNIDPSILIGSLTDYHACPNWINSFDARIIRNAYINIILNILSNGLDINKIFWGFKEIRYTKNDPAMDMWLELFPSSFIILSVRNPFDVIRSMIIDWNNPATLKKLIDEKKYSQIEKLAIRYALRWNNVLESFKYWIQEKKFNCYIEKYEDLLIDPEKNIEKIFKFLEIPVPENAMAPMSVKVGTRKPAYLSEICKIIYSLRKDIWQNVGNSGEYFNYGISNAGNLKSYV